LDAARKIDTAWFRRHADRRWHIRPLVDGEAPGYNTAPSGVTVWAVVHRTDSGAFARRFGTFRAGFSPKVNDRRAAAVWAYIAAHDETVVVDIPADAEISHKIHVLLDAHDDEPREMQASRVRQMIGSSVSSVVGPIQ